MKRLKSKGNGVEVRMDKNVGRGEDREMKIKEEKVEEKKIGVGKIRMKELKKGFMMNVGIEKEIKEWKKNEKMKKEGKIDEEKGNEEKKIGSVKKGLRKR